MAHVIRTLSTCGEPSNMSCACYSGISYLELKLSCVCVCMCSMHAWDTHTSTHTSPHPLTQWIQPYAIEISMCVCVKCQFLVMLLLKQSMTYRICLECVYVDKNLTPPRNGISTGNFLISSPDLGSPPKFRLECYSFSNRSLKIVLLQIYFNIAKLFVAI